MLHSLSDAELRQICRTNIEALEKWARLFIHCVLESNLGDDYFHTKNPDGNFMLKKSIIENADKRMAAEPGRFPTHLDTLFLEDIIYILCHNDLYRNYFSPYLTAFYPEGVNELRTFLYRLVPVRNKPSHTNPFSIRDAERAICYSNDFIDAVKAYFLSNRMEKEFNIPTVIKVTDSLGNEYLPGNKAGHGADVIEILDPTTRQRKAFFYGDEFSVTMEMDPSYPPTDYTLNWDKSAGVEILEDGKKINITIGNELIGEENLIACSVISNKPWHRFKTYDHKIILKFKALPLP